LLKSHKCVNEDWGKSDLSVQYGRIISTRSRNNRVELHIIL